MSVGRKRQLRAKLNWQKIIDLAALCYLALLIFWFAGQGFFETRMRFTGILFALGWPLAIGAFVVAVVSFFAKKWTIGLPLLILGLIICWQSFGWNLAAGSGSKAASTIRIVSASLRNSNKDMKSAAIKLHRLGGDVLVLQEVSDPAGLKRELTQIEGVNWYMKHSGSFATFSKTPLSVENADMRLAFPVKVTFPDSSLVIWSVHAPKAFHSPIENQLYFKQLSRTINQYKPDIVAGDLNSSQWNSGYGLVAAEMKDSHLEAGFGTNMTFPAGFRRMSLLGTFVRIDHIFVRPNINVQNFFTIPASAGADHKPVIADIEPISKVNADLGRSEPNSPPHS